MVHSRIRSLLSVLGLISTFSCPLVRACGERSMDEDDGRSAPADWAGVCQTGSAQSPINICTSKLQKHKEYTLRAKFSPAWCQTQTGLFLRNTQRTVEIRIDLHANSTRMKMGGAGFLGKYYFNQAHFHWGIDGAGSEHSVNKESYSMEIHLVHTKFKQYPLSSKHSKHNFAVLAIFVDADEKYPANEAIQPIVDVLDQASKHSPNEMVYLRTIPINLHSLLPENKKVYRYMGSLTTQPCTEAVLWTIFAEPIKISMDQLKVFRELESYGGRSLSQNDRPITGTNGREVFEHNLGTNCGDVQLPLLPRAESESAESRKAYKGEVGQVVILPGPNRVPESRGKVEVGEVVQLTGPNTVPET